MKYQAAKIFAKNMITRRREIGWTQEQAAKVIGITKSALGAYEEARTFPSSEKLIKIAKAYEISDLLSFISGKSFTDINKECAPEMKMLRKYYSLNHRDKKIVDILLQN